MNNSFYLRVNKTFFFLFFVFLLGVSDVSAQFDSARASAAASVGNENSISRQRIIRSSPVAAVRLPAVFDLEKTVFALLNQKRREKNLSSLEWSDDVAKIARMHSENMAKLKFFSHRGQDGTMVDDRADLLGISKWQAIGENIAFNQGYENPAEFAVERWMLSFTHCENILNNRWRESAVGAAIADDGAVYFTQVFLSRK